MAQPRLRVLFGSDELQDSERSAQMPPLRNMVSISLADIAAPLADAVRSRRNWVEDFHEEELLVSTDLYEVIRAYAQYRSEAA